MKLKKGSRMTAAIEKINLTHEKMNKFIHDEDFYLCIENPIAMTRRSARSSAKTT